VSDKKVYIINDIVSMSSKVGISNNPQERLVALQSASPHRLELACYFDGDHQIEYILHDGLKKCGKHIRGEWFDYVELRLIVPVDNKYGGCFWMPLFVDYDMKQFWSRGWKANLDANGELIPSEVEAYQYNLKIFS
jgi:hypothetical protein